MLSGMEHRVVLDAGGDDVVARLLEGSGSAHYGGIVRLRAATGEHHLARAAVQHAGHPFPGLIQSVPGLLPHGVDAGGVAEQLREVRGHCPQHFGRQRRGPRMVHVHDAVRGAFLSHSIQPSPG